MMFVLCVLYQVTSDICALCADQVTFIKLLQIFVICAQITFWNYEIFELNFINP
jgi:hypothetical protein